MKCLLKRIVVIIFLIELSPIFTVLRLICINRALNFSRKIDEMVSSQSSDVYDLISFKICAPVSVGQISQILSTSASDFRDCIKRAASVRDDEGDVTVPD